MLISSCILDCLPPCQKCFRDCYSSPHPQTLANVPPTPPRGLLGLWGPWWSLVGNYTLETCWNEKVFQTAGWSQVKLNSITITAEFPVRSMEGHLYLLTPYFLFSSLYIHGHIRVARGTQTQTMPWPLSQLTKSDPHGWALCTGSV